MKPQSYAGAPRTADPPARWQGTAGFSDPDFHDDSFEPSVNRPSIEFLSREEQAIYQQALASARRLMADGRGRGEIQQEITADGDLTLSDIRRAAIDDAFADQSAV